MRRVVCGAVWLMDKNKRNFLSLSFKESHLGEKPRNKKKLLDEAVCEFFFSLIFLSLPFSEFSLALTTTQASSSEPRRNRSRK
jgi:hypothetical protein